MIAPGNRHDARHSLWQDFPVLHRELGPILRYLEDLNVGEIAINRPGEAFVERLDTGVMERIADPLLTQRWIATVATLVASATRQVVNEERPLLSASLPSGERIQCVLPPAAPDGGALSIRKHVVRNLTLDDYRNAGAFGNTRMTARLELSAPELRLVDALKSNDAMEFLSQAVRDRISILVSGGTASGKTSLLNTLMRLIEDERIVTIEDARELVAHTPNTLSLMTSKGGQSASKITPQDLLEASLRMRPDRIMLGELRGSEAYTFIQAVNTGHPGSMATIHANSAASAYERLVFMIHQTHPGLSHGAILEYLEDAIPVVVHVARDRQHGGFAVDEVFFAKAAHA
jgi:type IV secretion system protein VirB11